MRCIPYTGYMVRKISVHSENEREGKIMLNKLKPIYIFLFHEHSIAFFRVCIVAIILCAFSTKFCAIWMILLDAILTMVIYAQHNHWDKTEGDE